jgi:hypothetical protein
MVPIIERVDHLVYTSTSLEAGMDEIEQRLGVRPVRGGKHLEFGTHNALLSLGPTTYLEVIAYDPELKRPDRGFPFGIGNFEKSRLATWALRTETISECADAAKSAGLETGPIQSGSRQTPEGNVLSWQLSDPYAMQLEGTMPFLISWGGTSHPADTARHGGELIGLRIEHPEPERIRRALAALGVMADISKADSARLVARINTANGDLQLD